jgi:hypothetical protein
MGEPAKPIDPTPTPSSASLEVESDPVLAAIRRAPVREPTAEELDLIEEFDGQEHTWLTTEEMMATVEAMRPPDTADEE